MLSNNLKFLNCNTTEIIVNNINQNIFNNKINNQNFNLLGTNTFYGQNININNGAIINNNNNQNNNYNFNQNNNKINFKNNFYNNNNINNNFNQNNNMNLMGSNNIIQYILENNKFLLQLIINFIHQNNNNPINSNLLQMTNNLIKINNNIQNDFNNMILMKQNIIFLLSNLNQINNNNMNQLYMNNNNQVSNYLKPIINCLNQIDNNINNIIKFYNNNYYQINNNNNFKNNDVLDNNNNKISKKHNEGEKKENKNYDDSNFLFKDYDGYFPLIGLKNVDSICYMNSILQCLLHIPQLNGFFINIYPEQKSELQKINKDIETRGRLCEEYHKIVIDIYKIQGFKRSYISPKDFINFLSQISGQFEEIDAKDFLSYLFQTMHSELNYLGDKKLINLPKCNQLIEKESFNFFMSVSNNLNLSIISYLFNGILKSTTICKSCKKTFYNFQFFQFLNFSTLNFNHKIFNLYQGFKDFIKPNIMSGEDKCYCQNCKGLRDMEITNIIYSTPLYLIINIDYGENKKYKPEKVTFGGIIDIKMFVDEYDMSPSIIYKLIAVCSYIRKSGTTGHYVSFCQNNEDKWYEFDDSSIIETKFDKVNSNSPFILIYKKL